MMLDELELREKKEREGFDEKKASSEDFELEIEANKELYKID